MKNIYLIRHFKVVDNSKKWVDSKEFNQWVEDYDNYNLNFSNVDIPKNIEKFFSSNQKRAIKTVEYFSKEYNIIDELKEVEAKVLFNTKVKMPKILWLFFGRILWSFNLLKSENRKDTIKRAKNVIEIIEKDESKSLLIVTHGFFMITLSKILKQNGYVGEIDTHPKNGKVYRFRRETKRLSN